MVMELLDRLIRISRCPRVRDGWDCRRKLNQYVDDREAPHDWRIFG